MPSLVEIHNIRKQYAPPDGPVAVKGLSLAIAQGEIFGLLGPNGAGKTTLIAMLSGLLAPSGGDALIDGHSIIHAPQRVKQAIGVVPQEIALYTMLSVAENLHFWGRLYGLRGTHLRTRVAAVLDQVELTSHATERVDQLSGGMQRRLNIAVGLLHAPKLLLLDEPTVGIDPQSRRNILELIKTLNQQSMTVLYTTHYMEEAQELSHRIGIIDHGTLIALGTLDQLIGIVGVHTAVRLELEPGAGDGAALAASCTGLPHIQRARAEHGSLLLDVCDVSRALPALFGHAALQGLPIRRMEIQTPNLETVFLHITGRDLRE